MKKSLSILFSILLIVVIVFTLIQKDKRTIESEKNIKIGYLAIAGSLPLFVGKDNNFFKEEGLNVELIRFKSSNEIAIAASTKQIDMIGIGATNAVIDASVTTGIGFKAFLLNGYTKKTSTEKATDYLLGREGINLDNLKGKKVAFFPGSISRVFANLILPKYGLTINDIEYIEMSPPNWISALDSGAIDAVTAVEPFAQLMLDKNIAHILIDGYYAEVMNDVPLSGGWFIENHLSNEIENKLYKAYQKSLNLIKDNRKKALSSFDNYTKITPKIYEAIGLNKWRLISEEGASKSLEEFIQLLNKNDAVKFSKSNNYIWKY